MGWDFGTNSTLINALQMLTERLEAIRCEEDDRSLCSRWLDSPLPMSPWQTWTLLCLVRHRDRQQFVADTVVSRLDGSLEALANASCWISASVTNGRWLSQEGSIDEGGPGRQTGDEALRRRSL